MRQRAATSRLPGTTHIACFALFVLILLSLTPHTLSQTSSTAESSSSSSTAEWSTAESSGSSSSIPSSSSSSYPASSSSSIGVIGTSSPSTLTGSATPYNSSSSSSSTGGLAASSDWSGLSEGSKIAIGLIFGLFVPCGVVLFCCWYRRKIQSLSANSAAYSSNSPRRRHTRMDEDEHRTHTLDLDDPHMEFSVQGAGTEDSRGGGKGRASRGYTEDGMEEVKLDGDEDEDDEEKRERRKKKKKKGTKKKKKAVDDEEDVDELELGGI